MNECLEFIVPKVVKTLNLQYIFSLILYPDFSDKFLNLIPSPQKNVLSVHAHI